MCISSHSTPDSLLAEPSTPSPTGIPAASMSGTRAMPAPRRPLETGQWAAAIPPAAIAAIAGSSRCTVWANHTSGPTQPTDSMYSIGVLPKRSRQNSSSSSVSARWVCRRTPRSRASSALVRSRSPVTENGEHGATAMRHIESGPASWKRSMTSAVPARIASMPSTTESGGRPPELRPRSIEPRAGWNRSPTAAAASISAANTSPASAGTT